MPWTFFRRPFYTDILVENDLTQARDLAMAERTFLATCKLTLTLAASASAFFQRGKSALDLGVSLSLAIGALLMICSGLWSYIYGLDGFVEERIFHHPRSFICTIVAVIILVMLINWYQYIRLDDLFTIF